MLRTSSICFVLWGITAGFLALPTLAQRPPEFGQWMPLTDGERQMKAPSVEKGAGAEVLFWRVHIINGYKGVEYDYIRLKVFDDSGKGRATTVELPFTEGEAILDVAGRTIKSDGTILELDPKTVFTRDVLRTSSYVDKMVSFAMPVM